MNNYFLWFYVLFIYLFIKFLHCKLDNKNVIFYDNTESKKKTTAVAAPVSAPIPKSTQANAGNSLHKLDESEIFKNFVYDQLNCIKIK